MRIIFIVILVFIFGFLCAIPLVLVRHPMDKPITKLTAQGVYIQKKLDPPSLMLLQKEGEGETKFFSIKKELLLNPQAPLPEKFAVMKTKDGKYRIFPMENSSVEENPPPKPIPGR